MAKRNLEKNDNMESAVLKAKETNSGFAQGEFVVVDKPLKIRFSFKALAFCASVVTLSWFFEGTRMIKDGPTVEGVATLAGGTVLTSLLVVVQGFFIYCEERSKGLRTRNIALFDKGYKKYVQLASKLTSKDKGDNTNRG